eukprot:482595_1
MDRLSHLVKQLNPEHEDKNIRASGVSSYLSPKDDDVVIVEAIRTAICKARKGGFKDTDPINLLSPCLKYVIKDLPSADIVDDICVGTVLAPGGMRATQCRQAAFLAGLPKTTTLRTVNRQCSSGLQSIADIAASITAGYINIGIAAGLESMTANAAQWRGSKGYKLSDEVKMNMSALSCLLPMGITSENVASSFKISRKEQDEFSALSHERAAAATFGPDSKFSKEILSISTKWKDPKNGKILEIIVDKDDGIRANTTVDVLSKLRPVFKKGGTTTAGNSSQVSDGAAAILMMKRSMANKLGLKIMARFTAFAVSGVSPEIMGVGPAYAIPKVCKQAGLSPINDIDLYEINEAFASQAKYCVNKIGLNMDIVNVNGGAIAFGHPLGCTGTRMTVTLLNEMQRRGAKRGIVSMCIGSGMGAAAIFERI